MANDTAAAAELACGLARQFEGFRPHPYLDPVGIPTVGYGFTRYADGRIVGLADPPIPEPLAEELLGMLMSRTAVRAWRLCRNASAGQLAALTDFAYNVGIGRLRASGVLRCAHAGQWNRVPAELRKWRRAGGRILPGLVLRREAEIALI